MKNYYDELEVSKKASKEVIEKVYKVLAKKYHPDTTNEIDKQVAEEKFKIISEAYEILSDEEKRKNYDIELEQSNPTISYEEYIDVVNQRDALNTALNKLKNSSTTTQYSHIPYNKVDFDSNTNNNTTKQSNNNYNNRTYTTNNSNQQKKAYYYTNTGKPASAFDYFKYKAKEFLTNLTILLLSILVAILIFNAFSDFNLFSFFIK